MTLSSSWEVVPDTYAEFDFPGRLIAREVSADQAVIVNASYTWDGVTKSDTLEVTILDIPPKDSGPDPWPTWGRTTTRLSNTQTVGPQTPRIEWSVKVDFYPGTSQIDSSCSMDAHGRVFQGQLQGMTAVDTISHNVLWVADGIDGVYSSPSVFGDRVFWGVTTAGNFFCSDAATGKELWRFNARDGYYVSPCADSQGVVYFNDRHSNVYARRMSDGAEVWTALLNSDCFCPMAMEPNQILLGGKDSEVAALRPVDGSQPWEVYWIFDTNREVLGTAVLTPEMAYIASTDRYVYAVDPGDGSLLWRFYSEQSNRGSLALGHDGIIYTATSGNIGWLFAISPAGQEVWRFRTNGLVLNSPIVAGDETIYVTATNSDGQQNPGYVHAVQADGTDLWTKQMPASVVASPMLAPDGTLYVVCRDKYLYAFRDPAGDLNYDKIIDLADYAKFDTCMTAPRLWGTKANTAPGCELLDFDRDWDVDLADYAAFQNAFGTAIP